MTNTTENINRNENVQTVISISKEEKIFESLSAIATSIAVIQTEIGYIKGVKDDVVEIKSDVKTIDKQVQETKMKSVNNDIRIAKIEGNLNKLTWAVVTPVLVAILALVFT